MSVPSWVLEAKYSDLVDECLLDGVSRLSLPACIRFQTRDIKRYRQKDSWALSEEIEEWRHHSCRGCKHRLRFEHQLKSVRKLLASGWNFEGRQRWRHKTGFKPRQDKPKKPDLFKAIKTAWSRLAKEEACQT